MRERFGPHFVGSIPGSIRRFHTRPRLGIAASRYSDRLRGKNRYHAAQLSELRLPDFFVKTLNLFLLVAGWVLASMPVLHSQTTASSGSQGNAVLLTAEGKVDVFRLGASDWTPAQTNMAIRVKDRLRTGLKSRATLRLSNQSVVRLNQLTSMEVEPDESQGKNVLNVQRGSTYFFNRENPVETEFKTPRASGAIRGTEFNIDVEEDGRTVVTLIDGAVDLKNEISQVSLLSGEQGVVDATGAPRKTAVLDAVGIIQWSLYYPGVVNPDDLDFGGAAPSALQGSIQAYRSGDLLKALALYPSDRTPASEGEKIYLAALNLAAGQVPEALRTMEGARSPLADALREVVAAVKGQPWARSLPPATSTEWLAHSYHAQSQGRLEDARKAARAAVEKAPGFGFAQVRLAELEFGFGRTAEALAPLNRGLESSPRNAQGHSLKGFMLAAQGRTRDAQAKFDEAIALDGALGNAWLGRGLCKIRLGQANEGRQDLQTAATLEPNRSMLRSYLGKAWSNAGNKELAGKELDLARRFDPNDPTPLLYSALLHQQNHRVNEGIQDLEQSKALNQNRGLFRSRMLLDQDQAVRSANLAKLYQDNGMTEVAVREASRAVNYDYASASAHLFLANSYFALLDPKQFNLRYQAPWLSELLLANLLAPIGGGSLSQNVSLHEYSRLFDGNRVGFSTATEYFSSGDWVSYNSHYGTYGDTSYSLDANYRQDGGQRPNNDIESFDLWAKIKHQVTPQDLAYVQFLYAEADQGDIAQNYSPSTFSATQRARERQSPLLYAGWNHQWQPGVHTLALAGWRRDSFSFDDPAFPMTVFDGFTRRPVTRPYAIDYLSEIESFSGELQQLWQNEKHQVAAGARFQTADLHTESLSTRIPTTTAQNQDNDLLRFSAYGYYQWQVFPILRLIGGVSYDHLDYPVNVDTAPVSNVENSKDQLSPKAGFILEITPVTYLRGAFTRSLGGVFFDNTVRLEPTQVAGFNQAYRSMVPESAAGLVPGTRFETFNAGLDHRFEKTRTDASLDAEWLRSDGERGVGSYYVAGLLGGPTPFDSRQRLDYEERGVALTLNQLLAKEWSVGLRYRISEAELSSRFLNIPDRVTDLSAVNFDHQGVMQSAQFYTIYNHRCGFFAQFSSQWNLQSNQGFSPDNPGDDFWQHHVYLGYRFPRRMAEIRVGVLNLTDRDYELNPLNLYNELPRERTFTASLKLNF